jgi:Flp pilus assembly protein TadD
MVIVPSPPEERIVVASSHTVPALEADCLYALERYPEAGTRVREALALRPDDPGILKKAGVLALLHGDRATARSYLVAAARAAPWDREIGELLVRTR